jgi:BlaI family transcriptional regulator, penicillinase repressor
MPLREQMHPLVKMHRFHHTKNLGPLEKVLMEALWRRGSATSRELLTHEAHLNLAPTTIQTVLDRLFKKGILDRIVEGPNGAFRYTPRYTETGLTRAIVVESIRDFLEDNNPRLLLSYLVDAIAGENPKLLDELDRMVARRRG